MSSEVQRSVPESMRLQKFLARAGVASRRASEQMMLEGRVRVNGNVARELGVKVNPATDEVTVDGVAVRLQDTCITLMLNKPAGYITTMFDPQGRPTVAQLVPVDEYPGLFPVGRLDYDTTGLLLFTNDGELGHALLHPGRHVTKTYQAEVDGVMTERQAQALRDGIMLDDGPALPAEVRIAGYSHGATRVEISIHEGRKRQVRRMCDAVGHPVKLLHRCNFGPLGLDGLAQGSYRLLTDCEVAALRDAASR